MNPTFRSSIALATLVVAGAVQPASAQDAAAVVVAPMNCPKPGDFAPVDRASPEMTRFQKRLEEYKNCVFAYTKTNGAKASDFAAQSRAYADAANGAIDDYNAYVTELNKQRGDDTKKK